MAVDLTVNLIVDIHNIYIDSKTKQFWLRKSETLFIVFKSRWLRAKDAEPSFLGLLRPHNSYKLDSGNGTAMPLPIGRSFGLEFWEILSKTLGLN